MHGPLFMHICKTWPAMHRRMHSDSGVLEVLMSAESGRILHGRMNITLSRIRNLQAAI
jgi:hypothetical protein